MDITRKNSPRMKCRRIGIWSKRKKHNGLYCGLTDLNGDVRFCLRIRVKSVDEVLIKRVTDIRDQYLRAKVPFFFKQWVACKRKEQEERWRAAPGMKCRKI